MFISYTGSSTKKLVKEETVFKNRTNEFKPSIKINGHVPFDFHQKTGN